ncbi:MULTISPECIES: hypothetical protein [Campylobacter]|uniref:Lipoprotein n=1 Tax=Campylobacter taeniopygiae TaxID=2510188 RepID=A0ABY2TJ47_9BACT|nr:hypothetical protein [Campylobacter taeniopygiae]MBZ7935690.1 hypothetical protein [Campylobacter sp. B0100352/1]TKX34124.1 hypothetical protein CQA75_03965 [Campylobacter taeniopygiae]
MSACANSTFVESSIQTNNEGIFLQAHPNETFEILFQNPSKIKSELEYKLANKLQNLGLKQSNQNPTYKIYLNLVDMKKHSYAQRISTSARFFYDFDPLESQGEWLVENYYSMQLNIEIIKNGKTQRTSLIARTAYLSNKERCQASLEDKILNQIASFFYFKF